MGWFYHVVFDEGSLLQPFLFGSIFSNSRVIIDVLILVIGRANKATTAEDL